MSLSPFGRSGKINRNSRPVPTEATLEDFSGGLDLSDSDLRLTTAFAKVLNNMHKDTDGTMSARWGTKFLWDVADKVTGNIIDIFYFRDKLLIFTDAGEIATILPETNTITAIWNSSIAGDLPGTPTGWSTGLTQVDWTEFKNELVVCNGIDKPILISRSHTVTYLQDLATGSNVFTPIGKFTTTVGNYTVIGGISASPDELYISSGGTSGTWPGDADPNDATSINIAAYTSNTGSDIRGLSSFRNMLMIHFATSTVVMTLGEYDSNGVHKPKVMDTVPEQGTVSHRTPVVLESDIVFNDERGVYKAKRNVYGNAIESERVSERIQVPFVSSMPKSATDRIQSFSVLNRNENRIMFFLRNAEGLSTWVMSFTEGLKRRAWSQFSGWNWSSGCMSQLGRIYFTKGTKVFQYGNGVYPNEDYTADFIGEYDTDWETATAYVVGDRVLHDDAVYICVADHTSDDFDSDFAGNAWTIYEGEDIVVDWEFPWTDTNVRMTKKRLSYMGIDTQGTAPFTIEVYTDNFRYDQDGDDDPALSIDFVAGNSLGYGGGEQPYGGGRRAADERLWGTPCEFKILKLRLRGSIRRRLKIVAISLLMSRGTYKR